MPLTSKLNIPFEITPTFCMLMARIISEGMEPVRRFEARETESPVVSVTLTELNEDAINPDGMEPVIELLAKLTVRRSLETVFVHAPKSLAGS